MRHILHEHLGMKKLSAQWMSLSITINQKQQRVDDSARVLALLRRNQAEFLRRFVTIDEIWIHYKAGIMKKRPHSKKKKILFHQGNALAHSSIKAMMKLHSLGYELLQGGYVED